MSLKKYRPLIETALLSVIAFVIHYFLLPIFVPDQSNFKYSSPELYVFFSVCALIIIFTLILVKQKSIDNVGNVFMLLTCIKMVLAYVFLNPILNAVHKDVGIEKTNFFLIFAIFLTIETIVAIRILNKPQ